jgi:riboflavin kinase/FMN adenylyltransferase
MHPKARFLKTPPVLISTLTDRVRLLKGYGMETVTVLPVSDKVMSTTWQEFYSMLRSQGAAGFVCGEDFRFGRGGEGNARLLAERCARDDIPCVIVPEQTLHGVRVSSTYIRQQIESGDMATAVKFLGHPYVLTGRVVPGKQLGRRLGIPTANLQLPEGLAIPKFGVYACWALVDGVRYAAVTNIGIRPTVSGQGITVEPWLLDYSGDLYGQEITLEFHRFLRLEQKFESLEALKAAIHEDAATTRRLLQI